MANLKYYILLLLTTIFWGATPACGKLLVDAMSPLLITGLRFLSISILIFAFLLITGRTKELKITKELLFLTLAMGFMGITLHNGLLFTGLHYTTATNTALIESIGPTATTLLAYLFIGERLTKIGLFGIFISCIGALCIVTKGSIDILINLKFNIGDLLILACEIAWSAYVIIGWRTNGKITSLALTAWSTLFGSSLCFVAGATTGTLEFGVINSMAVFGFSYLVLISGLFCFISWNTAVSKVGASKAGSFVYIVPLTGALLGITVLNEEVLLAQILGGILIILGVVITVRSKVSIKDKHKDNEDILKKFPELAKEHNKKLQIKEEIINNTKNNS